jgi:hypothetical protein
MLEGQRQGRSDRGSEDPRILNPDVSSQLGGPCMLDSRVGGSNQDGGSTCGSAAEIQTRRTGDREKGEDEEEEERDKDKDKDKRTRMRRTGGRR